MKFFRHRAGATAIEYGLIAAFMALVIVGAIGAIGQQTAAMFQAASNGFSGS